MDTSGTGHAQTVDVAVILHNIVFLLCLIHYAKMLDAKVQEWPLYYRHGLNCVCRLIRVDIYLRYLFMVFMICPFIKVFDLF